VSALATLSGYEMRRLDPAAIARADYWRSAPASLVGGGKEWTHFSVMAPQFDLIANFNLTVRIGEPGETVASPRLALLFRDAADWHGDAPGFRLEDTSIEEGSPDVVMGANSVRFAAGRYRLNIDLPARRISADLELRPIAFPVVANNIPLSASDTFSWAVVPRLLASGTVTARGQRYEVRDAPAYHDRNWGRFAWGGGCAWEWATIIPADVQEPWSLVFSRIVDRRQAKVLSQSLMVWRGDRLVRKFYGPDLKVERRGVLQLVSPLRIPAVAALALPGSAADVPRCLDVAASACTDELHLQLAFDGFAQVVFPNDRFPGLTALSECPGRARVSGRVGEAAVDFAARAHAEFNHAA
jgi:hypothetical protein